jgi:hypothetical protein
MKYQVLKVVPNVEAGTGKPVTYAMLLAMLNSAQESVPSRLLELGTVVAMALEQQQEHASGEITLTAEQVALVKDCASRIQLSPLAYRRLVDFLENPSADLDADELRAGGTE